MKKAIQVAKRLWLRPVGLIVAMTRPVRAGFAKVCKVCAIGSCATGKSCEVGRAAVAGMILFGIAGAGMGASGGFTAYGVASSAAGATVAVGWGPYWLLWTILCAAIGAAVGAGLVPLARFWSKERGPALAVLLVGAVGGLFTGATWGTAVARERIVEVRAQTANATPMVVSKGRAAQLSVVNGPVRLTGSVAREVNGLLLTFMLGSGALVGILAARGLSAPQRGEEPAARPFNPKANKAGYTA